MRNLLVALVATIFFTTVSAAPVPDDTCAEGPHRCNGKVLEKCKNGEYVTMWDCNNPDNADNEWIVCSLAPEMGCINAKHYGWVWHEDANGRWLGPRKATAPQTAVFATITAPPAPAPTPEIDLSLLANYRGIGLANWIPGRERDIADSVNRLASRGDTGEDEELVTAVSTGWWYKQWLKDFIAKMYHIAGLAKGAATPTAAPAANDKRSKEGGKCDRLWNDPLFGPECLGDEKAAAIQAEIWSKKQDYNWGMSMFSQALSEGRYWLSSSQSVASALASKSSSISASSSASAYSASSRASAAKASSSASAYSASISKLMATPDNTIYLNTLFIGPNPWPTAAHPAPTDVGGSDLGYTIEPEFAPHETYDAPDTVDWDTMTGDGWLATATWNTPYPAETAIDVPCTTVDNSARSLHARSPESTEATLADYMAVLKAIEEAGKLNYTSHSSFGVHNILYELKAMLEAKLGLNKRGTDDSTSATPTPTTNPNFGVHDLMSEISSMIAAATTSATPSSTTATPSPSNTMNPNFGVHNLLDEIMSKFGVGPGKRATSTSSATSSYYTMNPNFGVHSLLAEIKAKFGIGPGKRGTAGVKRFAAPADSDE